MDTERAGRTRYNRFIGSTHFKLEEFLPDNLDVSSSFLPVPGKGWVQPEDLKVRLSAKNLYGTAAAENRVEAQLSLSPGRRVFPEYRDYTFFDPFHNRESYKKPYTSRETDGEGGCLFPVDLSSFEKGSYTVSFYAEVYEKGSGRHVSTESKVLVSPLDTMVGYRSNGSLRYINQNSDRSVELIAVNQDLEKEALPGLTLEVEVEKYVSMLVKQENGLYKYQSVQKSYPYRTENLGIGVDGTAYTLPTEEAGRYKVRVKDDQGMVLNRFSFTVVGEENTDRSLEKTAELNLKLTKEDYEPGETAELFIQAPYAGAGLITVEQDKVYSYQWFETDGASTTQRVRIPANLEGSGYISVAFLRDRNSREIYMSPISYATVPFSLSRESRTNRITLDIPREAKPGEDFVINYQTSRKGKIVVYAVDEGILQVAGYRTPDPLAFFLRKRALDVKTAQILDLVLPENSLVRAMGAMGGGGYAREMENSLNPFKRKVKEPVVFWSGIRETGPEGGTAVYSVPDYFNGSLRVMAVAVSEEALGAAEERAVIRDSFTIKANIPMAAVPGDEFTFTATVGNNLRGAGDEPAAVDLSLEGSDGLEVLTDKKQTLRIAPGRDTAVTGRVRVKDRLGSASLTLRASGGGESSETSVSLSVRPPVPFRTRLQTGVLRRDKETLPVERRMYGAYAEREVSLSYLPLGMASGLNMFLEAFPYGCTEQIISQNFPYILPSLQAAMDHSTQESRDAVNYVIRILQARQRPDGQFGLWTSLSDPHPVVTVYAAHFLLLAEERGYFVPSGLREQALEAVEEISRESTVSRAGLFYRAYALYVSTLSGEVTTEILVDLVEDFSQKHEDWQSQFPALFVSASYALMKQDINASRIITQVKGELRETDPAMVYMDNLAYKSLYLYLISRHFPARMGDVSAGLLENIGEQLKAQRYSTFSANLALLAIDSYMEAVPTAESGRYELAEVLADETRRTLEAEGQDLFTASYSSEAREIFLRNPERHNLYYQVLQGGFDRSVPEEPSEEGLSVSRSYYTERNKESREFRLGDPVKATVRLKSLKAGPVQQAAVVALIPSGLEADIASIRGDGYPKNWNPDYIDIREDRIILYGTIPTREVEFSYQLRAVSRGTFQIPPMFAEAMYDREVSALVPAEEDQLTVKDAGE